MSTVPKLERVLFSQSRDRDREYFDANELRTMTVLRRLWRRAVAAPIASSFRNPMISRGERRRLLPGGANRWTWTRAATSMRWACSCTNC